LVIDDAIYSGHHLIAVLDNMTYELAQKTGLSQQEVGSHFKIHLVVPYTNPQGINEIRRFAQGFNVTVSNYPDQEIPSLNSYFDTSAYYPDEWKFAERFGSDSPNYPPVYFDHKVAGYGSSFPGIYLEGRVPGKAAMGSLLKENPSRYKIEELSNAMVARPGQLAELIKANESFAGYGETNSIDLHQFPGELQKMIVEHLSIEKIEMFLESDRLGVLGSDPWRQFVLSHYDVAANDAEMKRRFPDQIVDWKQILTYLEEHPEIPDEVYKSCTWKDGTPYTKAYYDVVKDLTKDKMTINLWRHAIHATKLRLSSVILLFLADPLMSDLHHNRISSILIAAFNHGFSNPETLLLLLSIPEISMYVNSDNVEALGHNLKRHRRWREDPQYGEVIRQLLRIGAFREIRRHQRQNLSQDLALAALASLRMEDVFEQILWQDPTGDSARAELMEALKVIHSPGDEGWSYMINDILLWFEQMAQKYGLNDPVIRYVLGSETI
jgi:hypothetical protein